MLLSCRAENLEWLWEKRIHFEAPQKAKLRTFQSCKADNNTSLRHEEVESQSWGFSVYLIGYIQDILWKQTSLNRKMIGTLGQIASTHLKNIYPRKVNKTWKQEKAAFENIIRSAAARIAATTLRVFDSLRFEETGRFVTFTADEILLWTVTFSPVVSATSYKLSQQQQFKKPSSFIWRKRI